MTYRIPFAAIALVALVLAHPLPSRATVLLELSVDDLARGADLVVIADVLDQWVAWDESDGRLKSFTRIRVESLVTPGDAVEAPGAELIVEQEGGFLEDFGVRVAGNAPLVPGERALLFLLRGDGRYFVFGMEQGKYGIAAGDGVPRVFRATTVPVAVRAVPGEPVTLAEPTAPWNGRTLDELLLHVQTAAEVSR